MNNRLSTARAAVGSSANSRATLAVLANWEWLRRFARKSLQLIAVFGGLGYLWYINREPPRRYRSRLNEGNIDNETHGTQRTVPVT